MSSEGYIVRAVPVEGLSKRLDAAAKPEEQPHQAKGFRASGLAYCLRQPGYAMTGVPETDAVYNVNYELAAAQGTVIHDHVQRHLLAAGLVYDYPGIGPALELSLSDCTHKLLAPERALLQFSGHLDAILLGKNGTLTLLDIKTVASKYMAPDCTYLAKKLQGYAVQVNAYMHFFATPDGRQVRTAVILLMSRDNPASRALYQIDYQPARAKAELERVHTARRYMEAGQLPPPEPKRGICSLCAWRSLCPEGKKREKTGAHPGLVLSTGHTVAHA